MRKGTFRSPLLCVSVVTFLLDGEVIPSDAEATAHGLRSVCIESFAE